MKNSELLLMLIKENPNLDILPLVAEDAAGEYGYTVGSFGEPSVEEYVFGDDYTHIGMNCERLYIRSNDEDDMFDIITDNHADNDEELTDREVGDILDNLKWKKAIFVYIHAF